MRVSKQWLSGRAGGLNLGSVSAAGWAVLQIRVPF